MRTAAETRHHVITTALTDEEHELLEAFAAEQEIDDLSEAIPALLHELVRLHDALWDAQFAQSTASLDALAQTALDEHRADQLDDLDTPAP